MNYENNFIDSTKKGYIDLKNKIKDLESKLKECLIRLKLAREHGDFSENAELSAEKEEKKYLDLQLLKLNEILQKINIIDIKENQTFNKVQFGVFVEILNIKTNTVKIFQIVGDHEIEIPNKVSINSPIVNKIINKKIGFKFLINNNEFKIIKIYS